MRRGRFRRSLFFFRTRSPTRAENSPPAAILRPTPVRPRSIEIASTAKKAATIVSAKNTTTTADVILSFWGETQQLGKIRIYKNVGITRSVVEELARRINLRVTPELTFIHDDSIAYGAGISAILSNLEISPLEDNESEESADGADNGDLFD